MTRVAQVLIGGAFLALVLAVVSHTRADPDLWGHVRFGQDIVETGGLTSADPYSFTSDRAWINHEWLAEAIMFVSFASAGAAGLILLKVVILGAMLWTAASAWPEGMRRVRRDMLLGLLVIGTVPQGNHVRPQLFSLLLFALLVRVLGSLPTGRDGLTLRRLLLIPVLLGLWANLHGGWIVGGGTLAIWVFVDLAVTRQPRRGVVLLAAGAAALVATLANPYGWGLWAFLLETVRFGRDQITDWQPVLRLGGAYVAIWLLVAVAAGLGILRAFRTGNADPRAMAVVVLLAVASFQVNRLLAFFAIAVVILFGRVLGQTGPATAVASAPVMAAPVDRPRRAGGAFALAASASIALIVLSTSLRASYVNFGCVRMDEQMFPEPEAARILSEPGASGRMLSWFDWGQYAIWHLSPRIAVSLDGRRETVYSEKTLNEQLRFYFHPDERQVLLARLRPDYIWLPAQLAITSDLVADGWSPLFTGPRSVVLARTGSPRPPVGPTVGPRCFPGP